MSKRKARAKVITEKKSQGKPPDVKGWSLRSHGLEFLIILFLIIASLAVFEPVRNHAFLNFDDNVYITDNPTVKSGLTLKGVIWAFTTMHTGNWHPLTWLSHMIDCQLYGLNPTGHHLTNLVFHIASTLLLFIVLKRMTGALWRSGFVAALFAVHPLHVESVAWVAERKDVLSTFFWMLTIWAYVRYVEKPHRNRYLRVFLFFILGLLSKPMLVTLPFVLLLLDYWPLGRFQFGPLSGGRDSGTTRTTDSSDPWSSHFRLVSEKVPLFIMVIASSVLTYYAQQSAGAVSSLELQSMEIRIANALLSYFSYVEKMIWPQHLAVLYPYREVFPIWKVVGAGLFLMCVSVLVIYASRRHPYFAVGWLWYLGTLVPVIGLVQVGIQSMADRYTYVPLIGLFIMIAWGGSMIVTRWRYQKVVLGISAGLLLLIFMVITRLQVRHWHHNITLYEHTLGVTSKNYLIHNNLGTALAEQGKIQEAIVHYNEALRIQSQYASPHNNLGLALAQQKRYEEAIAHFTEALRIEPGYADVHNNLGVVLVDQGRDEEAIAHFGKALQIKPDYAEAHYNLGAALTKQGKTQEANKHFTEAQRIKPEYAEVQNNLGTTLLNQGKIQEAIGYFSEALRIRPEYAEAHYNLGVALGGQGKTQEAIAHFSEALRIRPEYGEAHNNLGVAFLRQGKFQEAAGHFTEALRLKPGFADIHYNMGVALGGQGMTQEAIAHFTEALRIKPEFAEAHNNLGAALAGQGKIQEAIAHFGKALRIKTDYADAHLNLGMAFLTIGNRSSAIEEYKILKKLNPDLADILYQRIFR